MPVKALYCKEPELNLAILALRELANARIDAANNISRTNTEDDIESLRKDALSAAQCYLKAAESLEWAVDGNHEIPTPDEEKAELRKIIDELWQGIGYRYGGSLSEQIRAGVDAVKREQKEAYGLVATIIDDQRIRLEALRWILQQALDCSTHKSKDSSLWLGLRSIEKIIDELQGIDKDNPARYSAWDWHKGSFNTRKLNAEIQEKEMKIRGMAEQIETLKARLNGQPKDQIRIGGTYLTPFDPAGRVKVREIFTVQGTQMARVEFLEDHPHGYPKGSIGNYFAGELRQEGQKGGQSEPNREA